MVPTIKDIWNKLTGLEQRVDESDKAKASAEAIAPLKLEIQGVKADISKVESVNTQLAADLTTAQASIKSLGDEKAGIIAALDAACAAVKVEGGDAAKISALKPEAKIAALQTAVSDTLVKLQVPANVIPAPAPAATATGATSGVSVKSRAEFFAMSPTAQLAFTNAGGTIKD